MKSINFLMLIAISAWAPLALAQPNDSVNPASPPYGIFKITSQITSISYHLMIADTASLFGQSAFLSEIHQDIDEYSTHVAFWSGSWDPLGKQFVAEGLTRREASSIEVLVEDPLRIKGSFTTTETRFTKTGRGILAKIPFIGERIPEERELLNLGPSSLIAESLHSTEAEGEFVGKDRENYDLYLHLRTYLRNGKKHWIASFKVGQYTTLPLTGFADDFGILRLARPAQLLASDFAGLAGAVVKTARGIEFRGYFYVPRNGRLTRLHLQKQTAIR